MSEDDEVANIIDWRGPARKKATTEKELREQVVSLKAELRLERGLANKLHEELSQQARELLDARIETSSAQQALSKSEASARCLEAEHRQLEWWLLRLLANTPSWLRS